MAYNQATLDGQPGVYDSESDTFYPKSELFHATLDGKDGLYHKDSDTFIPATFPKDPWYKKLWKQPKDVYTTGSVPDQTPPSPDVLPSEVSPSSRALQDLQSKVGPIVPDTVQGLNGTPVAPGMPASVAESGPRKTTAEALYGLGEGVVSTATGIPSTIIGVPLAGIMAASNVAAGDPQAFQHAKQFLSYFHGYEPTTEEGKKAAAGIPWLIPGWRIVQAAQTAGQLGIDKLAAQYNWSPEAKAGAELAVNVASLFAPEAVKQGKVKFKTWWDGLKPEEKAAITDKQNAVLDEGELVKNNPEYRAAWQESDRGIPGAQEKLFALRDQLVGPEWRLSNEEIARRARVAEQEQASAKPAWWQNEGEPSVAEAAMQPTAQEPFATAGPETPSARTDLILQRIEAKLSGKPQEVPPASMHGTEQAPPAVPSVSEPPVHPGVPEMPISAKPGQIEPAGQPATGEAPHGWHRTVDLEVEDYKNKLRARGIDPDAPENADLIQAFKAPLESRSTHHTGWQAPSEHGIVPNPEEGTKSTGIMSRLEKEHAAGNDYTISTIDLRRWKAVNDKYKGKNYLADPHMRAMANIIREEVSPVAPHAQFFWHGGDEARVIAPGAVKEAIDKALENAKLKIDEYAAENGLDNIWSERDKAYVSTGINYGTSTLLGHKNVQDAIGESEHLTKEHSKAEDARKGLIKNVSNENAGKEVSPGAPVGQGGEGERRVGSQDRREVAGASSTERGARGVRKSPQGGAPGNAPTGYVPARKGSVILKLSPVEEEVINHLIGILDSAASAGRDTGKAVRGESGEVTVGRMPSPLPEHLKGDIFFQGRTIAEASALLKQAARGEAVPSRAGKEIRDIAEGHGRSMGTDMEADAIPVRFLGEGDTFAINGERETVVSSNEDGSVTVEDADGNTRQITRTLLADKGSFKNAPFRPDTSFSPPEVAPSQAGVAGQPTEPVAPAPSSSPKPPVFDQTFEDFSQAGGVAERTPDYQLTSPSSPARKPTPTQQGLPLGMAGKDLRAPERPNAPLTELPLEKATREAEARSKQPGLFDELQKAEKPLKVIGTPPVEVVSEQVGNYQSNVTKVTDASDVAHIVQSIAKSPQEKFVLVMADKDGRVLKVLNYALGTHNATLVHPQSISHVMRVPGVAQVWFAHNHPSGETTPSQEDYRLTERLSSILKKSHVDYAGHIIIAGDKYLDMPTGGKEGSAGTIEKFDPTKDVHDIPIVERRYGKNESRENLPVLSMPDQVAEYARTQPTDRGILLLDSKNRPVVTLSLSGQRIDNMDNPVHTQIAMEAEKANATSMILFDNRGQFTAGEIRSMASYGDLIGTQLLDAVEPGLSWRVSGRMGGLVREAQTPYTGLSDKELDALVRKSSPDSNLTFGKVFELGKRVYGDGKKSYAQFEFSMRNRMWNAWGKLKDFVKRVWDRLKAINEKIGKKGLVGERWSEKRSKEVAKVEEPQTPYGQPSKLNAFQREQVKTPAFKKWFGDSKVVDENGEPLVVNHGTPIPGFSKFNLKMRGGLGGQLGFWFASSPGAAEQFARQRYADSGPGIYQTYLSIQRPFEYNGWKEFTDQVEKLRGRGQIEDGIKSLRRELIKRGYDGVVIRDSDTDMGGMRDDWVAFHPGQIKSATGNTGEFNPENPSIIAEPQAPYGSFKSKEEARSYWLKSVEQAIAEGKTLRPEVLDSFVKNGGKLPSKEVPRGEEKVQAQEVAGGKGAGNATGSPSAPTGGKGKESSLAKRTESAAIAAKITQDFGNLAEYQTMNMKDQSDRAEAVLNRDYEAAKRIAMGEEPPPTGIREATMYEAVKIRALREGDHNTLYRLATESTVPGKLSEYGQAIKAADSGLMIDPVRDMQWIGRERADKAKRTGTTKAKVDELLAKLKEAEAKVAAYEDELAAKAANQEVFRMRRGVKRRPGVAKAVLDKEFSGLAGQLKAMLSPGGAGMVGEEGVEYGKRGTRVSKEIAPIFMEMARNRIEAGIVTVDGVVGAIFQEAKDLIPGLTKRDVRDAISGYGKTAAMSKDEINVKLRELKRQARLISALEDAEHGKAPLRSGLQRDAVSDQVRELQRQVKQAMRESGIDAEPTRSPEQRFKSALDAVKTRLRNQIHDLSKQIETGEKTPRKKGIEYDAEANQLKAERDKLRTTLQEIEGKPEMSPEQRVRVATAAVERSIENLERRIREKDLSPAKKESKTPVTPELQRLREQRDALRAAYKEMQDAAKPPKDPEAARLKSFKTRVTNEIARLENDLAEGNFVKPEKKGPMVLDTEAKKLKAARDRAKENYQAAMSATHGVTKEEAQELVRLSTLVEKAREEMDSGGDRLKYGAARVAYDNFVNDLKGENDPITKILRARAEEFKTTWKENKVRATTEIVKDTVRSITDNSIAMVASLDNSFLGRQGLHTLQTHPSQWYPAAVKSFSDFVKTLGGHAAEDALHADIYSRPNYINGEYHRAKIIPRTEEQFPTTLPERLPIAGKVFKASEVAFTGSALRMRTGLYDLLSAQAKEHGVDLNKKEEIEALGKLINSLTARGQWGKRGDLGVVRLILWAPKMLKGNIDVLTAHGFGAGLESSFARKQAAINLLKIVGSTAILMAIANALKPGSAELDPRSADFGKIKAGNTRFDITGGAASVVTLAARVVTNSSKSSTTGLVSTLGSGYGKRSAFDVLIDFLNNKTTPPVGMVTSWLKGKDRSGEPFTASSAAYNSFTPISIQNIIGLKDDHSASAVAGVILDGLGLNANTYTDTSTKKSDIVSRLREGKQLTPEQNAAFNGMNSSQQRAIRNEAKMSKVVSGLRHLSPEDSMAAWRNASADDKIASAGIMMMKMRHSASIPMETRIKNMKEIQAYYEDHRK